MSDQTKDLTEALMELTTNMAPIFDAADGIKADMQRRGWSPSAAESAALTWLKSAIAAAFRGQA